LKTPKTIAYIFNKQKKLLNQTGWIHLSMGTSHDYTVAIEEGATLIRLGTVLFGERKKH
jgi:uncharacterized pyridoxal phosphate-containing UPF0001 family protein